MNTEKDREVMEKYSLHPQEYYILRCFADNPEASVDILRICTILYTNGYLTKTDDSKYRINPIVYSSIKTILSGTEVTADTIKRSVTLAKSLHEIYPKGSKKIFVGGEKRQYPWRDSVPITAQRLVQFFRRYGNDYSDLQIEDATRRYVNANTGNVYMKLLKYFIFKDNRKTRANGDGYIQETSELLNYINDPSLGAGAESPDSISGYNDIGTLI